MMIAENDMSAVLNIYRISVFVKYLISLLYNVTHVKTSWNHTSVSMMSNACAWELQVHWYLSLFFSC